MSKGTAAGGAEVAGADVGGGAGWGAAGFVGALPGAFGVMLKGAG